MKPKSVNLIASYFIQWFDADYHAAGVLGKIRDIDRVNWIRCLPFVILHFGCLGIFVVGWSWTAVCAAIALYIVRMFAITGIYHRYFSHRTFKTSRPAQFLFALLGASSAQRGPLWWAANHRNHHRESDTPGRSALADSLQLFSLPRRLVYVHALLRHPIRADSGISHVFRSWFGSTASIRRFQWH